MNKLRKDRGAGLPEPRGPVQSCIGCMGLRPALSLPYRKVYKTLSLSLATFCRPNSPILFSTTCTSVIRHRENYDEQKADQGCQLNVIVLARESISEA